MKKLDVNAMQKLCNTYKVLVRKLVIKPSMTIVNSMLHKPYISSNMLGSLPWADPYGEAEVKTMQRQASEVLTWFTGMRADVPTWFS